MQESEYIIQEDKESRRTKTAVEVVNVIIDEVFPEGQDGVFDLAEPVSRLPEGVVNIDIEVRFYLNSSILHL